jgi:AraC-like DNA-binding protein
MMDGWRMVDLSDHVRLPGVTTIEFASVGDTVLDRVVMPSLDVTMVWELAGRDISLRTTQGTHHSARFACALTMEPTHIASEQVRCIEARVSPTIAYQLLGMNLVALDGAAVTVDDLWGSAASQLHEQLHDATSSAQRALLVNRAMSQRMHEARRADPEVIEAWRIIVQSRGGARVDQMARAIGWSRTRLWSRFTSQLGVTPKQALRLARFDCAAARLIANEPPALVAAQSGYSDQSHLHREVVSFTGNTPAALANPNIHTRLRSPDR